MVIIRMFLMLFIRWLGFKGRTRGNTNEILPVIIQLHLAKDSPRTLPRQHWDLQLLKPEPKTRKVLAKLASQWLDQNGINSVPAGFTTNIIFFGELKKLF